MSNRFLLNYGFAVEDNRDPDGRCHNEVRFYFDLERHDPSLGFKLSLLGNEPPGRGLRISANHDDQNSIEALSYARFICARVCALLGCATVAGVLTSVCLRVHHRATR